MFVNRPCIQLWGNPDFFYYNRCFKDDIEKKKKDNTYRVLKRMNRLAQSFPHAKDYSRSFEGQDIIAWCSSDYLGMSRHPEVLKSARLVCCLYCVVVDCLFIGGHFEFYYPVSCCKIWNQNFLIMLL